MLIKSLRFGHVDTCWSVGLRHNDREYPVRIKNKDHVGEQRFHGAVGVGSTAK